ncbi:MAG: glycosyltransferase [Endozoicomonadaceae bacterium]|nr:glycosyltransferase [Endozoicomonadaceae bacterium]
MSQQETGCLNPLVSVVAICYNHEKFVEQTLDSIILQSYKNIQLIIIDDKSSDNSVQLISEWIEKTGVTCTFIAHQKNCGLCATLNEALELCQGEYLQAIACDDILEPGKFAKQVLALQENPESALACSNFSTIDGKGKIIEIRHYAEDYKFPIDPFIAILNGSSGYKRVIHSPTVLVKKAIIEEIGGWREDLVQEDFYMWLQITFCHPVVFINIPLVKYRMLASSLSQSLISGSEMTRHYYEDHIKVMELFIHKVEANRLKVLMMEMLKRIEALEKYCVSNCDDEHKMQKILESWLNYRNKVFNKGFIISYAKKSLGKTIYQLWVLGCPFFSIYKPYLHRVSIKYRLFIALGIRYSKVTKFKALISNIGMK